MTYLIYSGLTTSSRILAQLQLNLRSSTKLIIVIDNSFIGNCLLVILLKNEVKPN